MAKKTKQQKKVEEKHDLKKQYNLPEAIQLAKEAATTKFHSSVDLAINLNIDPKKPGHVTTTAVALPHGTGKTPTILVLCPSDQQEEAKKAGADHVGTEELLQKIEKENWTEFDVIVTHPSYMMKVGKLGKVLGPKGLMPSPKKGTVTTQIAQAVEEIKKGKVNLKITKTGIIHAKVGQTTFLDNHLQENIQEIIAKLKANKPLGAKANYLHKLTINTTMGPGVKVNINAIT